jgi:hypothetical protein
VPRRLIEHPLAGDILHYHEVVAIAGNHGGDGQMNL